MAVLGRLLVSSAERLDLADFLSIDSFSQGDFKYLMKSFVGSDRPYILAGFDIINPDTAIGTASVSIRVADSVVYSPESLAGPFFHGLEEGNALSAPLVPQLKVNNTNFVYLTLTTTDKAQDTRSFWDPDKEAGAGGEFTQDVNTQTALVASINVSVSSFPANTIPIAKIVVGSSFISSIEDARDMMFRLGSGGLNPDPLNTYNFRSLPDAAHARLEPNTLMSSALDSNPFQGGDKNILTLKEWMDVVMTRIKELGGTTYWYEDTSTFSVVNMFNDILATSIKSKGIWQSSTATAGKLTWTEDIKVQSVSSSRDIMIRDGNKTLTNDQTMYITQVRDAAINTGSVPVTWTNAANYVNGTLGSLENLTKGDWIKKADDPDNYYLRVEEFYLAASLGGGVAVASTALSIKLSAVYAGTSEDKEGVYNKGVYLASEVATADRDDPALVAGGGDLYWLAMRSDTAMTISDLTSTTLSVAISNHDGITAKCTSAAHSLIDGQRITVAGSTNFDGTYAVEVEDANTFYITITGGPYADEAGQSAYYGTVTTATTSTVDGLLLESANHEFNIDQDIIISGTTNWNATYDVFPTGNTTFTIPVGSAIANETAGTGTAVTIYVRTDHGPTRLDQGSDKQIGVIDTENLMSFVGMDNMTQLYPTWHTTPDYNTIDGFVNYNALEDDNMTERVSKLTAMMADKAQDKVIKINPSQLETITNTTNAAAQEITFGPTPSGTPRLDIVLPSSDANGSVVLTGTLSLNANQSAYIIIDRNTTFSVANLAAVTIADTDSVPLQENTLVLATRLSGTDVWMWDEFHTPVGTTIIPEFLSTVVKQNNTLKLVEGGTWSFTSSTGNIAFTVDAYIQVPGLSNVRNTIQQSVQSPITLADGEVASVEVNRTAGGASNLIVSATAIASLIPTEDTVVIARRIGAKVIIGSSFELLDGQSMTLDQTSSDQTLTYIGATDTSDSDPNYTSSSLGSLVLPNFNTVNGDGLTKRLAEVTAMLADNKQDLNILLNPGTIAWDGSNVDITNAQLSVPGTTVGAAPVSINNVVSQALADNEAIYVVVHRTNGAALTVAIDTLENLNPSQQRLILVRRLGTDIYVG